MNPIKNPKNSKKLSEKEWGIVVQACCQAGCPDAVPETTLEDYLRRTYPKNDVNNIYQNCIKNAMEIWKDCQRILEKLGYKLAKNIGDISPKELIRVFAEVWTRSKVENF